MSLEKLGIDSVCPQCGDDNDLLVAITGKPCGKCARKNHKKAVA